MFVCLFVLGVDLIRARLTNLPKDWLVSRTAINSTSTVYKSTSWTRRGGDDVFEISTIRRCLCAGGREGVKITAPVICDIQKTRRNKFQKITFILQRAAGGNAHFLDVLSGEWARFLFLFELIACLVAIEASAPPSYSPPALSWHYEAWAAVTAFTREEHLGQLSFHSESCSTT